MAVYRPSLKAKPKDKVCLLYSHKSLATCADWSFVVKPSCTCVGIYSNFNIIYTQLCIMAYGSMPYVGMAPKKNGGHIKSAQRTRSKCLR